MKLERAAPASSERYWILKAGERKHDIRTGRHPGDVIQAVPSSDDKKFFRNVITYNVITLISGKTQKESPTLRCPRSFYELFSRIHLKPENNSFGLLFLPNSSQISALHPQITRSPESQTQSWDIRSAESSPFLDSGNAAFHSFVAEVRLQISTTRSPDINFLPPGCHVAAIPGLSWTPRRPGDVSVAFLILQK